MNHYLLPARKAATVPIDNTGLDAAARGQEPTGTAVAGGGGCGQGRAEHRELP